MSRGAVLAMTVLVAGAALAAAVGIAAGDAMKPLLWTSDTLVAPHPSSIEGRPAESHDGGVGYGPGKTPDYVIGTDWMLTAYREEAVDAEPPPPPELPMEPPRPTTPVSEDPPAEAPTYPSQQGDILAGVGVPPPPPPPVDEPPLAAD